MNQKLIITLDVYLTPYKVPSTQYFISELNIPQNERCGECLTKLKNCLTYNESPKLLILEYPYTTTKTSHKIKIKVNDTTTLLYLKGIHLENVQFPHSA
jgi:hypothetical protein